MLAFVENVIKMINGIKLGVAMVLPNFPIMIVYTAPMAWFWK
jgi:hypothetical protein